VANSVVQKSKWVCQWAENSLIHQGSDGLVAKDLVADVLQHGYKMPYFLTSFHHLCVICHHFYFLLIRLYDIDTDFQP
jgi:hypothetical protein